MQSAGNICCQGEWQLPQHAQSRQDAAEDQDAPGSDNAADCTRGCSRKDRLLPLQLPARRCCPVLWNVMLCRRTGHCERNTWHWHIKHCCHCVDSRMSTKHPPSARMDMWRSSPGYPHSAPACADRRQSKRANLPSWRLPLGPVGQQQHALSQKGTFGFTQTPMDMWPSPLHPYGTAAR
jgi:hypothetical protein